MNRQVRLAQRPAGRADDSTWQITTEPIPEAAEGEFTVRVEHVSLDPAMRGWISDIPSYVPPVDIGAVMRAHAVGRIHASRHPKYQVGQLVSGMFGVCEYAVSDANTGKLVLRLTDGVGPSVAVSHAVGMR